MKTFCFHAFHAIGKQYRPSPLLLVWNIFDIPDADAMVGKSEFLLMLTKIMSDDIARCILKPVRSVVL